MKLGIYLADQSRRRTPSHGIITYSVAMTNSLCAQLGADETCVVFASDAIARELNVPSDVTVRVSPAPSGGLDRIRRDQFDALRMARREGIDLLYFPKGFVPFAMSKRVKFAATLHDDIPLRYLRGSWGIRSIRAGHVYAAIAILRTLRRAELVTCTNEFVATSLRAVPGGNRSLVVTPPGAPSIVEPVEKTKQILVVTSNAPHKRSHETLSWISRLGRCGDHEFVSLGVEEGGVRRLDPPATSEEMNHVIARSAAVVFNSDFEGFGLPPMEAWALGTPAVYPLIEPMRTNFEGIPGGFEARSFSSFAQALEHVLTLSPEEVGRIQAVVRARFSWPESSGRLLAAMRATYGGSES